MGILDKLRRKGRKDEFPEVRESILPNELRELKEKISSSQPSEMYKRITEVPRETEHTNLSLPPIGLDVELKPRKPEIHSKEESKDVKSDINHKIEIILTKLDLLNERIKVIEEKLEKKGVI